MNRLVKLELQLSKVDMIVNSFHPRANQLSEQYFPVVLFIMPYNVVLTFESVDKILKCDLKASKQYFPPVLSTWDLHGSNI